MNRFAVVVVLFLALAAAAVPAFGLIQPKPLPACPKNETIKVCSGCEPTCETPKPMCNRMCVRRNICECEPGFYRHPTESTCVHAHDCPADSAAHGEPTCGQNELFMDCPGCEPICNEPEKVCSAVCGLKPKCQCAPGYQRDPNTQTCVKAEECSVSRSARDNSESDESAEAGKCAPNSELRTCPGCEPSCDDRTPMCPKICRPGKACQCVAGFVRSPNGQCVPETECPAPANATMMPMPCGFNQTMVNCPGCEPTCENPNPICLEICRPGQACQCDPGLVRNPEGMCVPVEECGNSNKTCGENEILKSCPGCEPSCDNQMQICPAICRLGQECECDQGFVRNPEGKCVKPETCPKKTCGKNEKLRSCPGCEPTCTNQNPICPLICKLGKECQCETGFVRNANGKCVKPKKCPKKTCGKNEKLRSCPGCEPTCTNQHPICTMICKLGQECQCETGFVRNAEGDCVVPTECPPGSDNSTSTDCAPNEIFTTCGTCERSCNETEPMMCTMQCRPAGCYCLGDNRRDSSGNCVPQEQCSDDVGPVNPCAFTLCAANTICRPRKVLCKKEPCPPQAECVPLNATEEFDPCQNHTCPSHFRCIPKEVTCIRAPCNPVPECVPYSDPTPPPGHNGTFDPCLGHECPYHFRCVPEQVQCIRAPCNPIPKCVPVSDPRPPEFERDTPLPAEGKGNVCADKKCPPGTICQPLPVQCFAPPCPPIAQCMPRIGGLRPLLNTPCSRIICPEGSSCQTQAINCLVAPCPPAIGRCLNDTDGSPVAPVPQTPPENIQNDFCMRARCANGPCIPVAIQCDPSGSKCSYDGACVSRDADPSSIDVCANSTCPTHKVCYAQEVQCFAPPCFPLPRCVFQTPIAPASRPHIPAVSAPAPTLDVCATVDCRSGMVCVACKEPSCTEPFKCVAPGTN